MKPGFLEALRRTAATGEPPTPEPRHTTPQLEPLHEQLLASLQERTGGEGTQGSVPSTLYVPVPIASTSSQSATPAGIQEGGRGGEARYTTTNLSSRLGRAARKVGTIEEVLGEGDERAGDGEPLAPPAIAAPTANGVHVPCEHCGASGFVTIKATGGKAWCGWCRGEGYVGVDGRPLAQSAAVVGAQQITQGEPPTVERVEATLVAEVVGEQALPFEEGGEPEVGRPAPLAGGITYDLPVDLAELPPFAYIMGPAGCLSGETTVEYRRGLRHSSRPLTLQGLYARFNGIATAWRDQSLPTFLHSLGDDGVMFYNRIVAVYESGIKALVRIELEEERYLRATPDHPILTSNGFVPAGDLKPGQPVICRGTMLAQSRGGRKLSVRPPRVIVNTRFHPYGAYKRVEDHYEYMRVARARLVVEADLNGLPYDEFVHLLKHNQELAATLRYIPTDFEVHHDDENTLNDELGNLVVMTKAQHARLHNQRGNFTFDSAREVKVKTVHACEEEMTYDVQMEAPANNFCANEMVVHNTGKTWQAKAWAAHDPEGVTLAATTGIAAVNLGEGTTINALLRFYDTASLRDAFTGGWLESQVKRLRGAGLRRIVLDEVSMLDGDQLTILCRAIDNVNQDRREEAGDPEVGLVIVGDFAQLSPVKAPYAFESAEWDRFAKATYGLTTIRRQADRAFIEALQAVRRGDAERALQFFGPRLEATTHPRFDGTTILAKNEGVEKFNQLCLDKVQGAPLQFESTRWGKLRGEWGGLPKPEKEWGVPKVLQLKVGALVMVLANHNIAEVGQFPVYEYVNGDLGTVVGAEHGGVQVQLQRTGDVVWVGPITRENVIPLEVGRRKQLKAEGHPERISANGKQEVIGACTYVPLRLAWASTVHKSQGLSLDQVQVNIRDAFFATPGMLYVALSRARTAEGLRLVGTVEGFRARCKVHEVIQPWL